MENITEEPITEDVAYLESYNQIYQLFSKKAKFLYYDPYSFDDPKALRGDISAEIRSINGELKTGERNFWAMVAQCKQEGKRFSVEVLADHFRLDVFEKRAMLFLLFLKVSQPNDRGFLPEQVIQVLDLNDSVVDRFKDLFYFSNESSAFVKHVLTFFEKSYSKTQEKVFQINPRILRQMTLLLRGEKLDLSQIDQDQGKNYTTQACPVKDQEIDSAHVGSVGSGT